MDFIKDILRALGVSPLFILLAEILRIEFTALEIKILENVHQLFKITIFTVISIALLACGFLFIHAALFLYLPWSFATKALGLLVLGLIYIVIAVIYLIWLTARRRWISRLGRNHIIRKIKEDCK